MVNESERADRNNLIEELFSKDKLIEIHTELRKKKRKATGVDGVTWIKYNMDLEKNIESLWIRIKNGVYYPKPSRRAKIPKEDGSLRPLGIPAYEDKIVQVVIEKELARIYENKFSRNSYGYRPNKGNGCHMALKGLIDEIGEGKTKYLIKFDIKGFFDNVNHNLLMEMLYKEISDRKFMEIVYRFLKAGYEDNKRNYIRAKKGVPQGGIMSPRLANIFLDEVLDKWIEYYLNNIVKERISVIRYADDFIMIARTKKDADVCLRYTIKRLKRYDLEISEGKTKVIKISKKDIDELDFSFLGFQISGKEENGQIKLLLRTKNKKLNKFFDKVEEYARSSYEDFIENIDKNNKKEVCRYIRGTMVGFRVRVIGFNNYYGTRENDENIGRVMVYVNIRCTELFDGIFSEYPDTKNLYYNTYIKEREQLSEESLRKVLREVNLTTLSNY